MYKIHISSHKFHYVLLNTTQNQNINLSLISQTEVQLLKNFHISCKISQLL